MDRQIAEQNEIEVPSTAAGERLDKFLTTQLPAETRSSIQRLIQDGYVVVDGQARKANHRLAGGETIRVQMPPPQSSKASAENIPLAIVFEDSSLLVINKPAGMVVHPAPGHSGGTLVNAILWHAPETDAGDVERPGIVHRLDRDTSGLMVVAKTERALRDLQAQFASRAVHKIYLALVEGRVAVTQGKIDAPLGRDPHDRKKIAISASRAARSSVTIFTVLERMDDYTLLQVEPLTGRTHQIRVHLAFIHHPVAGDSVYGTARKNRLGLERQFLHAARLSFRHPVTGDDMHFTAPLPKDLVTALRAAGGDPAPWSE